MFINHLESIANLNTGKVVPGKDKSKLRDSKRTTTQQLNANQSSKSSTSTSKKSSKK